ncbi:hypothetical protein J4Q44_G00160450 [Coregonus suidteri]|uniref:Large ribosomal subunit protein uL1m n=1 Tax=Coregonus suidteri TaxID=861788 RepID=A0AAN8LKL2_9TELE
MATCTRIGKVLAGCQRHFLVAGGPTYTRVSLVAPRHLPVRTYAAAKFYPKPVHETAVAVDLLKSFQKLDYTPLDQPVSTRGHEAEKKVDPFVSTVHLPHPFKTKVNKVAVFTENPDQVKVAQENGAAFVGGADLVQRILDDEVDADFYVAVPDMISKLLPLKNKLRKKFPKNKRGSVGVDIPKMLELFKTGHEYVAEKDTVIIRVGTLNMPKEQLIANIQTVVKDVCSHRPASFGHFIERAIVSSQTSEGLLFKSEELVEKTPTKKDV